MKTKLFELRDRATFIPIIAISLETTEEQEHYLLRRAGYSNESIGGDGPCILLTAVAGGQKAQVDPYEWGGRTYPVAHEYICENWAALQSGQVIDVEFILGETSEPKVSEKGREW